MKTTTLLLLSYFTFIFLVTSKQAKAQLDTNDFVTTWKTNNQGGSNDSSIIITIDTNYTYNYDVDWDNDGTFDSLGVSANISHQYSDTGLYTIRIRGSFPTIVFGQNNNVDYLKLISIDQWGTQVWKGLSNAFSYCTNLRYNATDSPNLDSITDLSSMFRLCSNFNGKVSEWDVSNIINMGSMFFQASSFNQNLENWDISSVQATAVPLVNGMFQMLDSTAMSISNYDSTLISWSAKSHNPNIGFGVAGLEFCLGKAARDSLITDGWTFIGDTLDSACVIASIEESATKLSSSFLVFPNPTSGNFYVQIDELENNTPLLIYNQLGQLVKEEIITKGKNKIDLNGMAEGIYFLKYGTHTEKLVLNSN